MSTTTLNLGATESWLRHDGTGLQQSLALGLDRLVQQCLRHTPPRPVELEHAIEVTEDVVMPLATQFGGTAELVLQGPGAALIAAAQSATLLTLEDVEALFNRLVMLSEGRPVAQETLPTDARFFAAMVVLRETLHHLRFAQVRLQPQ